MSILGYIVKRTIYTLIVLFLIAVLNFFLFEYIPMAVIGLGPSFFFPPHSGIQGQTPDAVRNRALIQQFGLDQPWIVRFEKYVVNIFTGNFGYSISSIGGHQPVWQIISQAAPNTFLLIGVSTIVAIILGAFTGVISASRRGKFVDLSTLSVSVFAFSVPTFWIGTMLLYFFGIQNHWFPGSLSDAVFQGGSPLPVGSLQYVQAYLWAAALPIFVLTLVTYGGYQLILRNTMNDVLTEDYIMMARAKGLSERTVLYKHAFRNALLPLLTSIAIAFGFILSGAVITETVFSFTGLGYESLQYIVANDYPVLQGLFFLIALMVVAANFVSDIAYGFLDPRVSY